MHTTDPPPVLGSESPHDGVVGRLLAGREDDEERLHRGMGEA